MLDLAGQKIPFDSSAVVYAAFESFPDSTLSKRGITWQENNSFPTDFLEITEISPYPFNIYTASDSSSIYTIKVYEIIGNFQCVITEKDSSATYQISDGYFNLKFGER